MLIKPIDQIGSEGFSAFRISPTLSGWPLDPFLHVEFRHYHGANLPPRPKAGRICIHHAFEDSPSALLIRNSLGERHVVQPGCGLISMIGKGMIEGVSALEPSKGALSLMAAVNLSPQDELKAPRTAFISEWPGISDGSALLWDSQFTADLLTSASIHCVRVIAGTQRDVTPEIGQNGILALRKGIAKGWKEGDHCRVWEDSIRIEAMSDCEFWYFSGIPLQSPLDLFGPFSMSDRLRNRLAALQYRRGDWGTVPSE